MTISEMVSETANARNETLRYIRTVKRKFHEAQEQGDGQAEDEALDELILWHGAKTNFDAALNSLVQLEHLSDEYFGKKF